MVQKTIFIAVSLLAILTEAFPGMGEEAPPCGVPRFVSRLPADVQSKISQIWKNYVPGAPCEQEHSMTREILHSLPGRPFHKRGPPPFLQGLPQETLDKFQSIMKDRSVPWPQKRAMIDELAMRELKGDNLKTFLAFKEKMKNRKPFEGRHRRF